jgi:hypothetical protein
VSPTSYACAKAGSPKSGVLVWALEAQGAEEVEWVKVWVVATAGLKGRLKSCLPHLPCLRVVLHTRNLAEWLMPLPLLHKVSRPVIVS